MKVLHQTGHREVWNINSFLEDKAGDGIIFSPVNLEKNKLEKVDKKIKASSFFDPQFYLINDRKGKLNTYNFLEMGIETSDYDKLTRSTAKKCLDFQIENNFLYNIIPSRYFDELPINYYEQSYESIISPFVKYHSAASDRDNLLMTVIIKETHLKDEASRNNVLNWITSIREIKGVYLIFEDKSNTKQIKDSEFLFNAILFIHYLKMNKLEVHIGYTNTEGILYSIAQPDSISMGSYENLRNFSIRRFESTQNKAMKSPRARLYVGNLYQWIDYDYIKSIVKLYPDYKNLIEHSRYNPTIFEPTFEWHFQKPELYKHFFKVFSDQVNNLPDNRIERINSIKNSFKKALEIYKKLSSFGIALDENSDGSHLTHWINTISYFEKYMKENPYEF